MRYTPITKFFAPEGRPLVEVPLRRLIFPVLLILVSFIFSACTGMRTFQRAYIDPKTLRDAAQDSIHKSLFDQKREVKDDGVIISVTPLNEATFMDVALKRVLRRNLTHREATVLLTDAAEDTIKIGRKTCFLVNLESFDRNDTEFQHVHLWLDLGKEKVHRFLPAELPEPNLEFRRQTIIQEYPASYERGGKFALPSSRTHDITTGYYENVTWYCHPKKWDLTSGFTVLVDLRRRKGPRVHDLVWATDPESKKTFKYFPGAPYMERNRLAPRPDDLPLENWLNARYQANEKKTRQLEAE